ncbi:MAG TPA: hypothetical protein VJT49_00935 [Amycolatopsis sp.]|nr:hypothetical protein [Amycolatopsis sp.]HKS43680.1 hypothetical protein [Amycolatopsis sp.]
MRSIERITGRGLNGVKAAAILYGIAEPAWHQSVAWHDAERRYVARRRDR